MPAKQLRLPKTGRLQGQDRDPRAHLYATMHLLAACEATVLDLLDDEECAEAEYLAREGDLDTVVDRAARFYARVIGPLCRSWWLA